MLLRTSSALEDCENHLSSLRDDSYAIEYYLVQYLLVCLCSEMLEEIRLITNAKANGAGDLELSNFVNATSERVFRSVRKSEISTYIGFFGEAAKDRMNQNLDDQTVTQYGSAVTLRHDVAHKSGAQMTISEFKQSLSAAKKILEAFTNAINEN